MYWLRLALASSQWLLPVGVLYTEAESTQSFLCAPPPFLAPFSCPSVSSCSSTRKCDTGDAGGFLAPSRWVCFKCSVFLKLWWAAECSSCFVLGALIYSPLTYGPDLLLWVFTCKHSDIVCVAGTFNKTAGFYPSWLFSFQRVWKEVKIVHGCWSLASWIC